MDAALPCRARKADRADDLLRIRLSDDRLHRRDGIYARVADRDRHRVREQPLRYFYAVGPWLLVIREGDALALGRLVIRAGDLS